MKQLEKHLINNTKDCCFMADSINLYRLSVKTEYDTNPDDLQKLYDFQQDYKRIHGLKTYEMYYNLGLIGYKMAEINLDKETKNHYSYHSLPPMLRKQNS